MFSNRVAAKTTQSDCAPCHYVAQTLKWTTGSAFLPGNTWFVNSLELTSREACPDAITLPGRWLDVFLKTRLMQKQCVTDLVNTSCGWLRL